MSDFATAGSETIVNTTITNTEDNPSITALAGGGWIVVWEKRVASTRDTIFQQQFDADGNPVGSETTVLSTSQNDARNPQVTALDDGGWLVTYEGSGTGDTYGIFQIRYDSTGSVDSGPTLINSTTTDIQLEPHVTVLTDGGWIVAWSSYAQDGSGFGVYQQRYDRFGNAVASETQVNTTTASTQLADDVLALEDGGWIVFWSSNAQDGNQYGVYQQRYDANGDAVGSETLVNTTTDGSQLRATATLLANGGWVVVWADSDADEDDSMGIMQQLFDADGNAVGGETKVNSTTADQQHDPSVTALSNGGWVVTWVSYDQDGDKEGIYQQIFDPDGTPFGDETLVNVTTSSSQDGAQVTTLEDGSWVVTWFGNGPTDGAGIFQRKFTAPDVPGTNGDDALSGTGSADTIKAFDGSDLVDAGAGNDDIDGGAGSDFLRGGADDDQIDGGADIDTAVYSGNWSDYAITKSGGTFTIVDTRSGSPDGTDTVDNVEFFAFGDGTVSASDLLQVAPTGISASSVRVAENSAAGTSVGTLSATDANALDSFTFALTSDASGFFEIIGNKLKVKAGADLDWETASNHDITVKVTDAAGGTFSKTFTIKVGDVAEKLSLGSGSNTFKDTGVTEVSIKAGRGNDTIKGLGGSDKIFGQAGKDLLFGGSGKDTLSGGAGKDVLAGGGGVDTFIFATNSGMDVIRDFDAKGAVHDLIDLSGLTNITGWKDLNKHHLQQSGSDAVIDGLGGDTLVLKGVDIGHLDKGDFLF